MTDIWYCVHCGYEVPKKGKCHNCKQPLTASPLKELSEGEVEDEVGYSLEEWEDTARGELIAALVERRLRHRFDGDELVVAASDEETVDQLVDELSTPDEPEEDDEPADQELSGVMARLYDAAQRLKVDPTDMIADGDLAEAAGRMFGLSDPPGVEAETWAAVGRVTRRLLGALGADEALEDEIAESSQLLCRLLEESVDEFGGLEPPAPRPVDTEAETRPSDQPVPTEAEDPGGDEFLEDLDPLRRPLLVVEPRPADKQAPPDAPAPSEALETDGQDEQDEQDEMVYELEDWMPEERAQITLLLEQEHIAHIWEGLDLVVDATQDARVEALMSQVDRVGAVQGELSSGDDDEARYHVISNLFGAADRLAGDGENEQRQHDVVDAAERIQDWATPFAMGDDDWWKIRFLARSVRDSIEAGASPKLIEDGAAGLRDMLRKFV
ncbi:MAG: hypothetical protein M3N98_16645 [Actinomycetota bacterium]|nr:hypothetical protein [Actinomycetota bacterium]